MTENNEPEPVMRQKCWACGTTYVSVQDARECIAACRAKREGTFAAAMEDADHAEMVAEHVGDTAMTEDPPEEPLVDPAAEITAALERVTAYWGHTCYTTIITESLDELVANHAREVEQLKARLRVVESGASRAMIAAIDATEKAIDVAAEESP